MHDGSWQDVRDHRQKILDEAWTLHPERFRRGRPQAPQLPARVWINQPPATIEAGHELQKTATS